MNCVFFDLELIAVNNGDEFEKMISKVEYKAGSSYLESIVDAYFKGFIDEIEYRVLSDEHSDLKNRVLEEVDEKYRGKIDFLKNYEKCESNEKMIDYIKKMSAVLETYIIFYYNTERERQEKEEVCKKYFPNCHIIAIKYYEQEYCKNIRRKRTNKAEYIKKYLNLEGLDNNMLVDKSATSCDEWNELGGYAILERNKKISQSAGNMLKITR